MNAKYPKLRRALKTKSLLELLRIISTIRSSRRIGGFHSLRFDTIERIAIELMEESTGYPPIYFRH